MLSFIIGTVLMYLGIANLQLGKLSFEFHLMIASLCTIMFTIGVLMLNPAVGLENGSLALRFLVVTTIQMLSFLSVTAAFAFGDLNNKSELLLNLLFLFLSLMTGQSIFLIKTIKRI